MKAFLPRKLRNGYCVCGTAESENVVLARRYHKTNFGRISRQTQMNSYMSMIRSRLKKG